MMNQAELTESIKDGVALVRKNAPSLLTILPYQGEPLVGNEVFFFLKPEITQLAPERFAEALAVVFGQFERYRLTVRAVSILGADFLKRHRLIEAHYGLINRAATEGVRALSPGAKSAFERSFGQPAEKSEILGAFEFLARFPEFTPASLREFWARDESVKLAGGVYVVRRLIGNEEIWLINGFHPLQVEHFTAPGRSIVAFVLRTETPWRTLRHEMLGATAPNEAVPGSLRRYFWENRDRLGIIAFNQSNNGAHLSAGPLESIAEIRRFLRDNDRNAPLDLAEIATGRFLLDFGIDRNRLERLVQNEPDANGTFPFDATEDLDTDRCAETLLGGKGKAE